LEGVTGQEEQLHLGSSRVGVGRGADGPGRTDIIREGRVGWLGKVKVGVMAPVLEGEREALFVK
jgi:hypothetical protein